MLSISNQKNKNSWFNRKFNDGVDPAYRPLFYEHLNVLLSHEKKLIDSVITKNGRSIAFPMETNLLENYLDGFDFVFTPFDNQELNIPHCEGFYKLNTTIKRVEIFYNTCCSTKRQRWTKIHEMIHFCQSIDGHFLDFIDYLYHSQHFPKWLIPKLIERATDKATAIYLMPNQYFLKKYQETSSVMELSEYFQVSQQSVSYRLKECRVYI